MKVLGRVLCLVCTLCGFGGACAQNYSDIWWNPLESGWGITIADHQAQLFAVWFTYGVDNQPTWFVLPGGSFNADRTTFAGDLYQTTGPAYTALPFDPQSVTRTRVGTASFNFAPSGTPVGFATFTYSIGNVTQTKNITRQGFGSSTPWWGTDFTDIWWNPLESGWGLTLAQHGNNVFGVWYTYGGNGKPLFIVMPTVTFSASGNFTGPLYTTTGPSYTNPLFNPANVTRTQVGSASLAFSGTSAMFASTVNGLMQSHSIVRQPFGDAAPPDPNPGGETWRERGVAVGFLAESMPQGAGSLIMPDVMLLADGSYRMYFSALHPDSQGSDIWLADSPDATTWTLRGMVLAGAVNASDPEYEIAGPSVVHLPDGRWRMYYQASPYFDVSQGIVPSFQFCSAISSDGVHFQREGVRIPNNQFSPGADFTSAAHGRVVALDSGGYEVYISSKPRGGAAQGVYELHSDDGLSFAGAQIVLDTIHDPIVVKSGGRYVMYVDPSPNSGFTAIDHALRLTSTDGLNWSAPSTVLFQDAYGTALTFGGGMIGDLAAVVKADGNLRLFSNYFIQNIAFYDLTPEP